MARRTRIRNADPSARVVAVTGAAGFLGRHLLPRLAGDPRHERILALDVRPPPVTHDKIVYRAVDLTRPAADQEVLELLRGHEVDTLVHLAFLAEPTHRSAWGHELESAGTQHVLDACAAHGVRKVVMASTTACYGPHPGNPNFLTEAHPLQGLPGSRFVGDKVEAEGMLGAFKARHPETTCTVLRFAPVVGPNIRNWVTRYLSYPTPLRVLGYDPLLQFLHETDAVDALVLAAGRAHDGAFNVVGDGVLPLSTVLRLTGRLAMPLPWRAARAWTEALWAAQLIRTPPSFLAFLRYLCVADGEKARRELGFVPRYSTRQAVQSFAIDRRPREATAGGPA